MVKSTPYAPAAFTPRKYSWYSFLLQAESTPWPWCGRKHMSMANSSATTRNLTCDLLVCTAVQLCHRVTPHAALTKLSVTEAQTVYCAVRNTALNLTSIHFRLKAQIPVNYRSLFKLYPGRSWVDGVYLSRETLSFVKP
jgi:hypothetical protein